MECKEQTLVTAMSTIATVTITSYVNHVPVGQLYKAFYDKTIPFSDDVELLRQLEGLFDSLSFPSCFEEYRHFLKTDKQKRPQRTIKERVSNVVSENAEKSKGTFVIHVQFRMNATWQGTIHWVEQNKRQYFRSTLEMIRLIDEAMQDGCEEPKIEWE